MGGSDGGGCRAERSRTGTLKPVGLGFVLQPMHILVAETEVMARFVDHDMAHQLFQTHAGLFHFRDHEAQAMPDFYDELVNMFGDVAELRKAVKVGQEARNAIFYASSDGYPTGFDDPSESLARECQLTLGLIWGAIDLTRNEGQRIPFIEQALATANRVIAELKR